jgi:protein ImuA
MSLPLLPDTLRGTLWQADQLSSGPRPGEPSGHPLLDAELPGGGWPPGALTELLLDGPGRGELRLLAPLLVRLSRAGRTVVCIDPPCRPHGPALAAWGIDLARLLWVSPGNAERGGRHDAVHHACWAADQALAARCGAVLCWTRESASQRAGLEAALRRLHLKAQEGDSLLFLLRPATAAQRSSPSPLRVHCQPWPDAPTHLAVHLLKRRGPAMSQPLRLDTRAWLAEALLQRLDQAQQRPLAPFIPTPSRSPALPALAADVVPPVVSPVVVPAPA